MTKKADFHEGYKVVQEGDKQTIIFRGDGLSWAAYVVFPIALPLLLLALGAILPFSWWPIFVILIGGLGYLIYTMFQAQSFTLTPEALIKSGVEYDLARISEVIIDNPMDSSVEMTAQPSMIIGGTGIAGGSMAAMGMMASATTSAAAGASMAIAKSSAKRRYRVLIRYGARTVKIARNLKHDRAVVIFSLLAKQ